MWLSRTLVEPCLRVRCSKGPSLAEKAVYEKKNTCYDNRALTEEVRLIPPY